MNLHEHLPEIIIAIGGAVLSCFLGALRLGYCTLQSMNEIKTGLAVSEAKNALEHDEFRRRLDDHDEDIDEVREHVVRSARNVKK